MLMEEKILKRFKELTSYNNVKLVSRGNSGLFASLFVAKSCKDGVVLITDQGGWFSYKKYPLILGMKIVELKTNHGVIDLEDLKLKLSEHDVSAIVYSNPAGYYAEQPVSEIFELCVDCKVILDCSGGIGSKFCDGNYSDIMFGSFGEHKPIDLGYGGFVACKFEEDFNLMKDLFTMMPFSPLDISLTKLWEKLLLLDERYAMFSSHNTKIKDDLFAFNILHKEKDGINVVVGFDSDNEKNEIIKYCNENNYSYTLCPRYIRVKRKAVSIEVKRCI